MSKLGPCHQATTQSEKGHIHQSIKGMMKRLLGVLHSCFSGSHLISEYMYEEGSSSSMSGSFSSRAGRYGNFRSSNRLYQLLYHYRLHPCVAPEKIQQCEKGHTPGKDKQSDSIYRTIT
jgi:hypothetical protein